MLLPSLVRFFARNYSAGGSNRLLVTASELSVRAPWFHFAVYSRVFWVRELNTSKLPSEWAVNFK